MPSWKKLIVSGSDAAIPSVSNTGDFTIDAGGDIILDADGTDIFLKDNGTSFGRFKIDTSDFIIKSEINNKDIVFRGQDGGSTITALTIDMSDEGHALFTGDISGSVIRASGDVIAFNSSALWILEIAANSVLLINLLFVLTNIESRLSIESGP